MRVQTKKLCELTGLTYYAVNHLALTGVIPYIKVGSRKYFEVEAVEAALKAEEEKNRAVALEAVAENERAKEKLPYVPFSESMRDVINKAVERCAI